jgi:hypothetical protein
LIIYTQTVLSHDKQLSFYTEYEYIPKHVITSDGSSADDINIMAIINLYINRLYCYYDYYECQCYYKVSDLIRCPNTKNSLNKVIRIIEYGTLDIQPLFWLRKSYYSFIENIAIYIK